MGIAEIFKYISLPFFYSFIQNGRKKREECEREANPQKTHFFQMEMPLFPPMDVAIHYTAHYLINADL